MGKRRREREQDVVHFSLFDTVLGPVAIAYTDRAVVAVHLPEGDPAETRNRLLARRPDAIEVPLSQASAVGADAAGRIAGLLAGNDVDLDPVPVDVSDAGEFNQQVYAVVRLIGRGETLTYGEVARRAGEPGGAQAVGRAMAANPIPVLIPCHRVVGANRELTGFSANGGIETKRRMLLAEGSPLAPPSLFDEL